MKRNFLLLLSLVMILGTVVFPAPVAAVTSMPVAETMTVLDFTDEKMCANYNMEAATYEDEAGGKMVMPAVGENGVEYPSGRYWFDAHNMPTDFSDYRKINVRFYASKAGVNFTMIIFRDGVWNRGYMSRVITAEQAGWQTATFSISDFTFSKNYLTNTKHVGTLVFAIGGGYSSTAPTVETAGSEVCINSVWASDPYSTTETGVTPAPEGYVIADLTTTRDITLAKKAYCDNSAVKFDVDTSVKNLGDQSAKWTLSGSANPTMYFDKHIKLENYRYLNLWVHANEAAYGKTINCTFRTGNSSGRDDWTTYVNKQFTVDWSDDKWHQVTLEIFGADGTPYFNNYHSSITANDFTSGKAPEFGYLILDAGGFSVNPVTEGMEINTDLIWLSQKDPTAVELGDNDKIIYEFNNSQKINSLAPLRTDAVDGSTEKLTADSDVTNMHGVSARWEMNNSEYNSKTDGTKSKERGFEMATVGDATEYNYINLLVHSNKASEIGGKVTAYMLTSDGGWNYWKTAFPVDFSGWKVVSLPIKEFTANKPAENTWTKTKAFILNTNGFSTTGPENGIVLNFDMIWYSKENPSGMVLKNTNPPNGYADMSAVDAEVEFSFNNVIKNTQNGGIVGTLKKANDTEPVAVTCTTEGNKLVFAPEKLEFETEYTLTIPSGAIADIFGQRYREEITYSFTTCEQGLAVSAPLLTDDNGNVLTELPQSGNIKATVNINNTLDEAQSATLILASYDDKNRMIACDVSSVTVPFNGKATVEATVPAYGTVVKAFVVDALSTLHPLQNTFTQLPPANSGGATQTTGTQSLSMQLQSVETNLEQLFIAGRVDGALPRMAIIAVKGETETKPLFLTPVMAEQDGTISVETNIPEVAESGIYQAKMTARRIDGEKTAEFYYANPQKRESLNRAINAAESVNGVAELLTKNSMMFRLPNDKVLLSHIYTTVFEQKPYESYEDFVLLLAQAQTVLNELNTASWAGYEGILKNNSMILNGSADETYYSNLNTAGKIVVGQQLISYAPFESFAQFRSVFAKVIAEYKNNAQNSGSGTTGSGNSGGGGGSSGGGKSIFQGGVTVPAEMIQQESESEAIESNQTEKRFIDLAAAEWARESVERLYEVGAIAPAEQFRPNDDVTREEFVKLMIESLGLEKGAVKIEFTDVDSAAWYAPYLAAAQSLGIVTGYEDGRFGVGEKITRQDMAVMLIRALANFDVSLTNEMAEEFADDSEISGYARGAVYAMKEAGVINGVGDDCFAPTQNASRAEAAKMLCELLNLLKK